MEIRTILVLYIGKRFGLEYNHNLMICCVYIIYTIVSEGVTIIVSLFIYVDDYS